MIARASPRHARRPRHALSVLAAAALALALAAAPAGASLSGAVARRIDAVRTRHHLPAVREDARMARTARGHAVAMARYGFLAHDSRNGSSWQARVARAARTPDVGEVLATLRGVSLAREARTVVLAWLRSPAHRAVLLSRRYGRIGVGRGWVVHGAHRTAVYTVDFAAR